MSFFESDPDDPGVGSDQQESLEEVKRDSGSTSESSDDGFSMDEEGGAAPAPSDQGAPEPSDGSGSASKTVQDASPSGPAEDPSASKQPSGGSGGGNDTSSFSTNEEGGAAPAPGDKGAPSGTSSSDGSGNSGGSGPETDPYRAEDLRKEAQRKEQQADQTSDPYRKEDLQREANRDRQAAEEKTTTDEQAIAKEAGSVGPSANTGGSGGGNNDLPEERTLAGGGAVRPGDTPMVDNTKVDQDHDAPGRSPGSPLDATHARGNYDIVETETGDVRVPQTQKRDLFEQLERQTLQDLDQDDVRYSVLQTAQGPQLSAELTATGRQDEQATIQEAVGAEQVDPFYRDDLRREEDSKSFQEVAGESDPEPTGSLSAEQVAKRTPGGEFQSDAERKLVQDIDEQFPQADIGRDDVRISREETEEGTRLVGELTRQGRKEIATERAPFQNTPLEAVTEAGASVGFEGQEFRRQNREEFDQIVSDVGEEALEAASDAGQYLDPMPEQSMNVEYGPEQTTTKDVAGAAGVAVATPEPVSTGVGLAVGSGLAAGAALDAATRPGEPITADRTEITVPDEQTVTGELNVPSEMQQGELEPPTTSRTSELQAPQSGTEAQTELDTPQQFDNNPDPNTLQTAELIGRQQEQVQKEEETPEISEEYPLRDLPEPDQHGPSTRERQRRDDLYSPERTFPTGEESVVGRPTIDEEQTPTIESDEVTGRSTDQATQTLEGIGDIPHAPVVPDVGNQPQTGARQGNQLDADMPNQSEIAQQNQQVSQVPQQSLVLESIGNEPSTVTEDVFAEESVYETDQAWEQSRRTRLPGADIGDGDQDRPEEEEFITESDVFDTGVAQSLDEVLGRVK